MEAALGSGEALATDAAEYLVDRGVPFREAHEAVGKAARLATSRGSPLASLSAADWKAIPPDLREGRPPVLRRPPLARRRENHRRAGAEAGGAPARGAGRRRSG